MKRLPSLVLLIAAGAAVVLSAQAAQPQQQIAVTLIGKPGNPPQLAVPPFVVLTADQATQDASKLMTDVLSADLRFEREFDVMPASGFMGIPSAQKIEDLPYDAWTQRGAEYVALGTVKAAANGRFDVEVHVVRIKDRREAYGAAYSAAAASVRGLAHRFSDEIHKNIRGVTGIAQTKIAFSSTRDGERAGKTFEDRNVKEIYIMDYDGENQRRITVDHYLNISANWCPDSQCVAYMSYQPASTKDTTRFPDIKIQNIYGQIGQQRPAHGTDQIQNYSPAISPDGTKVAFASTRNGDAQDIYVVNRDGSGLVRLTNNKAIDGSPAWSPTGNLIAFTSDRAGSLQLFVMNPDGSGVRKVENSCSHCDRPTFAPGESGLLLAYSTQTSSSGHDIELFDFSNNSARRLTNGESTNESPSFAPNGRHVVFFTSRWGKNQLAVIDIDGKNIRQLTKLGANTFPAWSGLPK